MGLKLRVPLLHALWRVRERQCYDVHERILPPHRQREHFPVDIPFGRQISIW